MTMTIIAITTPITLQMIIMTIIMTKQKKSSLAADTAPQTQQDPSQKRKPPPPVPPRNVRASLPPRTTLPPLTGLPAETKTTTLTPTSQTTAALLSPRGPATSVSFSAPGAEDTGGALRKASGSISNTPGSRKSTGPRAYSVYANTSSEKSGWLQKKGKKRWFVLSKGELHWYNQAKQQGGTSNGSLAVADCEVTCLGELQGGYALSIIQKGGSEYILSASSLTEMEDWVLTLMRAGSKGDSASLPGAGTPLNASANSEFSTSRSTYAAIQSTKSGWLEKKGRKRWFVLRKGEISWFKSTPMSEEAFKRDMAGHLDLKKCRVRKLDDGRKIKGKFGMFLCTVAAPGDSSDEGVEYLLLHPKEAEISEWVEFLLKEGAERDGPASMSMIGQAINLTKPASGGSKIQYKLFGGDLKEILAREGRTDTGVPMLVERCVDYIRRKGMDAEGVFRLSGDSLDVNYLKKQFQEGATVSDKEFEIDVHAIASLLKLFFRELEPPLMTYELYDTFMIAATKDVATVRSVVLSLPPENLNLAKYLIYFLHEVSTYQAINKMAPANLSICFSPNLFRSKGSPLAMLTNSALTGTLTQMMISYPTYFWPPEPQPTTETATNEGNDDNSNSTEGSDGQQPDSQLQADGSPSTTQPEDGEKDQDKQETKTEAGTDSDGTTTIPQDDSSEVDFPSVEPKD
eukprot:TRINITY_DN4191_c0_g1_i1.p1 TRINITY_DN4191_c0_g1~~TRINITY_DN4191_c0_g1_i1.p1  ORF type:complete len:686 (+),score=134.37 TRINITY_DN4191_c0_g1_i1:1454-3511(+)